MAALSVIFHELHKSSDDSEISPEFQKLTFWRERKWEKRIDCHRIPKKFDVVVGSDQICHDGFNVVEFPGDSINRVWMLRRLDNFEKM
jgi:hypothetical protein